MAIIYSYPLRQPKRDDLLIGTITYDENAVNPVQGNPTVSFTIGSLLDLIAGQGVAQNLQQVTNIGNTTTNSIVISNSLKVAGEYYDSSNQPGTAGQILSSTATGTQWVNVAAQGVTSVGLSMPAAFTVTNSPVTQAGVLTVAGAGTAAQYIDGTGALQTFTTYGKWVLAGDTGVQDVTTGQTASILGGTDIATVVTSPRTLTINHSAVTRSNTTATASPNPGDTVDLVSIVSSSATGHVTGVETTTVTWPANQNTTYTIDVPTATTSINLKGSDSTDDAIALVGGTNITITRDNDSSLTFASLNTEYTAGTGLTLNTLEFDVNVNSTAGNAPESLTTTANRTYAIQLDNNSANLVVNVPWVDTDTIQTITGTGSDNTDSGILLSDSGGTVLILGSGSVTASQTGNTITLTGTDTDTGITGVTLATADSTGAPLSENITNRELTLTSAKYVGGANVGYVPEGGTATTYLKGDGTWAAIPTGLQFKGTWDASGGGGGNPDLTLAANKGAGFLWICDVAGTAYPNGGTNPPSTWNLGDWAVYDGTAWTRVPATNSGVTSLTTTDGTFIDLTPNVATTGAVTVTADLSAQDGTSDTSTRFLSKDNTWDVPSYSDPGVTTFTNENGTFISAGTVNTNATGAVTTGIIDLSATGTKDSTTFLRGDNTWDVPPGTYTLPVATSTILGGIELGSDTVLTTAYVAGNAGSATRSYPVQLNANRQAAVYVPWENTQNPNQTITGAGSNNTDSGITLNESGGTVLILGATGIAASQAANTVTLTGTTYGINFQPNSGASPQINPFLRLTGTGTSSGTTDLEIVGTGATTVTRNSDNKITINSTAGSYSWDVRDNSNVDKEVLNGEYLKFVTATGALDTALTGTGTNTDPYIMTLTSPNTTYSNFTGADGTTAGTAGLVPAPAATDNVKFLKGDGTWATTPQGDITEIKVTAPITGAATSGIATIGIDTMGAATANTAGTKGAVPASAAGDQLKFLRADATWVVPTDTNTWVANSKLVAGYVAAPGAVASKVWKTDASGNPAWRDDATGDNNTYSLGSGNTKVITLTRTDVTPNVSAGTVTFADGSDISIAGNNGTITITNESPDTGLPAIIVDDAAGNMSFGNANVTASTVRTKIGAGTGDGIVTSLTTTGTSGASTLNAGVLNIPEYENTQENTTWYVRDSADADKTVNNNKYLKFVTATGALGTALTGAGSTSDPYVMTLTSPNTQGDNDYLTALAFDDSDGVLTATVQNQSDVTVDLDGRYLLLSGGSLTGDLQVTNEITVNKTDVNTPGKITINGNTDATLQLKSEDTALAANETLGVIEFYGSDGTSPGAGVKSSIRARNGDQTGGTGNKSNLIFAVSPGNAANNTEKMRINPTGSIAFNGATNYGTSGQLLQSNGDASPTWVNAPTGDNFYVTGASYSGGTLTLTRNGGLSDLTATGFSQGDVTGTGSAGRVAFWTSATNISNDSAFEWDSTNNRLSINGPIVTDPVNRGYTVGINGVTQTSSLRIFSTNPQVGVFELQDDGNHAASNGPGSSLMTIEGNNPGSATTPWPGVQAVTTFTGSGSPGSGYLNSVWKFSGFNDGSKGHRAKVTIDYGLGIGYLSKHVGDIASDAALQIVDGLYNGGGTLSQIFYVAKGTTPKVGIGTNSPSGLLHIKSGSINVFHADGTCGNVGIKLSNADITSLPEAAFTVKGNMSYAYANYLQVAFTYTNVIDFNGFPAGIYQLNLCTQSNASSYGVFTVKWSGSAGTVINTLVSGGTNGGYGLSFSGTVLRSISNVNTATSANLQCLVTYETCQP